MQLGGESSGSSQRPIRHAKDLVAQDYFRPGQIKFRHEHRSDAPPCVRNEIEDERTFAICRYILIDRPCLRHWFMSTTLFSIRADLAPYISPFPPSFNASVQRSIFTKSNGIRILNYQREKSIANFSFSFFPFFFLSNRVLTFSTPGVWESSGSRRPVIVSLDDKFIYIYIYFYNTLDETKGGIFYFTLAIIYLFQRIQYWVNRFIWLNIRVFPCYLSRLNFN